MGFRRLEARMILSHTLGFVFIKGRKVASTSVEMALSTLCGAGDIVTPITPIDERARLTAGGYVGGWTSDPEAEAAYRQTILSAPDLEALAAVRRPIGAFYNHMSLARALAQVPEAAALPVVFVERNPYAKVLSRVTHRLGAKRYAEGGPMIVDDDTLKTAVRRDLDDDLMASCLNIDLYRRPDGSLAGRRLRHEHLDEDVRGFVDDLGRPPVALPHAKAGAMANALDPRVFFSRAQLDRINQTFAEEFEAFAYERL